MCTIIKIYWVQYFTSCLEHKTNTMIVIVPIVSWPLKRKDIGGEKGGRCVAVSIVTLGYREYEISRPRSGRLTPEKDIQYPLYRRLQGPQEKGCGEDKNFSPTGVRTPNIPPVMWLMQQLRYPWPN